MDSYGAHADLVHPIANGQAEVLDVVALQKLLTNTCNTFIWPSAGTTTDDPLSDADQNVTSHWLSRGNCCLPQPITIWSEILHSPEICVAVVVAVVFQFRR